MKTRSGWGLRSRSSLENSRHNVRQTRTRLSIQNLPVGFWYPLNSSPGYKDQNDASLLHSLRVSLFPLICRSRKHPTKPKPSRTLSLVHALATNPKQLYTTPGRSKFWRPPAPAYRHPSHRGAPPGRLRPTSASVEHRIRSGRRSGAGRTCSPQMLEFRWLQEFETPTQAASQAVVR